MSTDDLKRLFSGGIDHLFFLNNNFQKINPQSCDCDSVLMKIKGCESYIRLKYDRGTLAIDEIISIESGAYDIRHTPSQHTDVYFDSARFNKNGVAALKFIYGDRYLFFFAEEAFTKYDESGWLIVTITKEDIFKEGGTSIPDFDDSELCLE